MVQIYWSTVTPLATPAPTPIPTLTEAPSLKTITISGNIVDSESNPLIGYTVELHSDIRTTTTDNEGYFEFNDVEDMEHTIVI